MPLRVRDVPGAAGRRPRGGPGGADQQDADHGHLAGDVGTALVDRTMLEDRDV